MYLHFVYPPHFNPSAIKADLSLSNPKEANSSQLENADNSKWAPTLAKAEPVSF